MKITLAQLNPIVGDISGNLNRIRRIFFEYGRRSDLIVFPELFICGYPPRDLLEKPDFISCVMEAVEKIKGLSMSSPDTGIILGTPFQIQGDAEKDLFNSAILICGGEIISRINKSLLPTYDVFDEERYFHHKHEVDVTSFRNRKIGISICEDMWNEPDKREGRTYLFDPIQALIDKGASMIINIAASPFYAGKQEDRYTIVSNHARKYGVPFVFVNQVGGNDELIFDGNSLCIDRKGAEIAVLPSFEEDIRIVDIDEPGTAGLFRPVDKTVSVYKGLVMGLRDYMRKCSFSEAVVGLSGGIDSAVTACIAVESLGKPNVHGVLMPSLYTSQESIIYAEKLADNLGIDCVTVPIDKIYERYIATLNDYLSKDGHIDITLQNIQARIRGNVLMALSNRFGYLVLSTGNKSELAVGYSTLYGDLAGGLAVISDLPKTLVYEVADYINRTSVLIPEEIINRAPSAELKPGQTDQESLPPYELLDKVLFRYIEKNMSSAEIVKEGFSVDTVEWVIDAVNKNEYKRRQAPPGLKVTSKAFGTGRRMPIAAKLSGFDEEIVDSIERKV